MSEKKLNTFDERLKDLRKKKGLTQAQLAELLYVTDKAVSKWETGEGKPEINILIELAKVLDVSLDYLLTGEEKEPEIVTMSKVELCCKEDNVEIFETIELEILKRKDESGQTILTYIDQYNSKKVYEALLIKVGVKELFNFLDSDEKTFKLFFKFDDVESLGKIDFFGKGIIDYRKNGKYIQKRNLFLKDRERYRYNNYSDYYCIYSYLIIPEMIKLVLEDGEIIERSLSLHGNYNAKQLLENIDDYTRVYNEILYSALIENKKNIFDKTIELITSFNDKAIEQYEIQLLQTKASSRNDIRFITEKKLIQYNNHYYSNELSLNQYPVIAISIDTIKELINLGYLDYAKLFNNYNKTFKADSLPDGVINAEYMKKDGNSSKDEIFIESCLNNGILMLAKVLESNNYKVIQKAFDKYPITVYELLDDLYQAKKYNELYKYAIDHDLDGIAKQLLNLNDPRFKESYLILEIERQEKENDANYSFYNNFLSKNYKYPYPSLDPKKPKAKAIKEGILNKLAQKIDKETITKGLTKDYFESLLTKNYKENAELLVIKLCVKLEAIFKCDYNYEGTFEEMMSKFTSKYGQEDDGWGYMVDSERTKLFHKLRKIRNNIVHSEQTSDSLTNEELEKLIKYVCELG